jgi:hypothetical protein
MQEQEMWAGWSDEGSASSRQLAAIMLDRPMPAASVCSQRIAQLAVAAGACAAAACADGWLQLAARGLGVAPPSGAAHACEGRRHYHDAGLPSSAQREATNASHRATAAQQQES